MAKGIFITGTDTNVGKTTIALALMSALQQKGLIVAAMKPVSAGCENTKQGLRNEDAVRLMQQASIELPYAIVNPYAFAVPIAPHIAAAEQNITMNIDTVKQAYQHIAEISDVVIVEGAGGWLVPFNETQTMGDVARELQLDVIQAVGMKLGCLNHALLTTESITSHGLTQVGWIANQLTSNMLMQKENIQTIQHRIKSECLGVIPKLTQIQADDIAQYLTIDTLL